MPVVGEASLQRICTMFELDGRGCFNQGIISPVLSFSFFFIPFFFAVLFFVLSFFHFYFYF